MKVVALGLAVLSLIGSTNSAIAQTASLRGPWLWIPVARASSEAQCRQSVLADWRWKGEKYLLSEYGVCLGLKYVGYPVRDDFTKPYEDRCQCPYQRRQDGTACADVSAYISNQNSMPKCYGNDPS